jgi:hypothetical protein
VNFRAIGCLVVGVAAFVGLGLYGLSLAFRDAEGCPPTLQWSERTYVADGAPLPSPDLGPGEASYIGSTFMGPITRRVYGPPGSSPSTDAEDRPDRIALDCADGTFQAYRWDGALPPIVSAGASP